MPTRMLVKIPWREPVSMPPIQPARPPMMMSETKWMYRRAEQRDRLIHENLPKEPQMLLLPAPRDGRATPGTAAGGNNPGYLKGARIVAFDCSCQQAERGRLFRLPDPSKRIGARGLGPPSAPARPRQRPRRLDRPALHRKRRRSSLAASSWFPCRIWRRPNAGPHVLGA